MHQKINFGELLKKLRFETGFAQQADLAKAIKVSQQTISRWESGNSLPKVSQIAQLARIFKVEEQLLLEASRYTNPSQHKSVTISYDHPFPFMSLTAESFERFCTDLLKLIYNKARVYQWGGAGHKQQGIDIKIDFPDGTVHTYQCKRETEFGPQKVKEAIEYQSIVADKKFILLARIASPLARQEVSNHSAWEVWDQEDLSRIIRHELCKQDQIRLVDTYFSGQRMAFLGEPGSGIWRDSSSYFAPFMNPSRPLNHTLPLIGRQNESQQLYDACIKSDNNKGNSKRIIYLVGTAGIGKSRLLKHVIDKIEKEKQHLRIWFWDGISIITPKDLESLGEGQKILVVTSCRKAEDLRLLIDCVFRDQDITLIIATQYDELARIKDEAGTLGIVSSTTEEIHIKPLSENETQKLALCVLKANEGKEKMANHIAKWTTDSPLATILSIHLSLSENISFAKVRGHQDYTSIIKGKFSKLLIGEIGQKGDQQHIKKLINILALVQPFRMDDASLFGCLEELEQLTPPFVKRLLSILTEAGILWKNQNDEYRLSPEILGDFLIEDICVGVNGAPTGYADRVYEVLEKKSSKYRNNLIYNLNRFEWTKNMNNTKTDKISLLDIIWSKLNDTKEDIEIVERSAYYLPKKTLGFVKKVIISRLAGSPKNDVFVESDVSQIQDLELYEKHSPEYLKKLRLDAVNNINRFIQPRLYPKAIFDDLTPIIQTVALHNAFLAEVSDLLWLMSKHYDASSQSLNANCNHPIRILKEIFSYSPNKAQDYLTSAVNWATDLLQEYNVDDHPFSPFNFLNEIMRTDGSTMEVSVHKTTTSDVTIDYEFAAPLRNKVIEAVLMLLASKDSRKSYESALFFCTSDCIVSPTTSKHEWTNEGTLTLKKVQELIRNHNFSSEVLALIALKIERLQTKESIDQYVKELTNKILDVIQYHMAQKNKIEWLMYLSVRKIHAYLRFGVESPNSEIEITNMIRYDITNLDAEDIIDVMHKVETRLNKLIPNVHLEKLNSLYWDLLKAEVKLSENILKYIVERRIFTSHTIIQTTLLILLSNKPENGIPYLDWIIDSEDVKLRLLAAHILYQWVLSFREKIDITLLKQTLSKVVQDQDLSVFRVGFRTIHILAPYLRQHEAIELLLSVKNENLSEEIIETIFQTVSSLPCFDSLFQENKGELIASDKVDELLQYLISVKSLMPLGSIDFGIREFLKKVSTQYPELILSFILKRATHAVGKTLLEHSLSEYQIMDEEFFTFQSWVDIKQKRIIQKDQIYQWLKTHENSSQSYMSAKRFLMKWIFEESDRDPKVDKLMGANTKHVFEKSRNFIRGMRNGKALTQVEAKHQMNQLYNLITEAVRSAGQLKKEPRNFAESNWRESRELQIFHEEIKPIYAVFEGYKDAYAYSFESLQEDNEIKTKVIPMHNNEQHQTRYCVQISPITESDETTYKPEKISYCGHNEQYDGYVEFSNGFQQKIEVTVANKGEEQGKIKASMHQHGYTLNPMNNSNKIAKASISAIGNKLNQPIHKNKYQDCWLVVVLHGWALNSIDDCESFMYFFMKTQKEVHSIDWSKIQSIIIYPGN